MSWIIGKGMAVSDGDHEPYGLDVYLAVIRVRVVDPDPARRCNYNLERVMVPNRL
jgi:hypothetical protein